MTDCGAGHPESGQHHHDQSGGAGRPGHGVTASSDSRYIAIALGLIAGFLVFEVIMAFAGHSLALLADAGHMPARWRLACWRSAWPGGPRPGRGRRWW